MTVRSFFHPGSSTLTYVVHAESGRAAVVIDPVRDFDFKSGHTSWNAATAVAGYIDERRLQVPYVIDTHAHADHLRGMPYFKKRYGSQTVTGARVGALQKIFQQLFNLAADFPVAGEQFDVLLDEEDRLEIEGLTIQALHTPGHTPAHMSWQIGDSVFVGDTLFMPDYGTARCDFPGGSPEELYESIQRLYRLPDETRLFMCHDYRPNGRELRFETTVVEQKRANVQLNARTSKAEYVAFRHKRDAELAVPELILPSIQVNIRAGALPAAESNGVAYLKIPIDACGSGCGGAR
jgi:glyoxylase-like metal-dependent hydrolase (beta-lactamase superfamily II)